MNMIVFGFAVAVSVSTASAGPGAGGAPPIEFESARVRVGSYVFEPVFNENERRVEAILGWLSGMDDPEIDAEIAGSAYHFIVYVRDESAWRKELRARPEEWADGDAAAVYWASGIDIQDIATASHFWLDETSQRSSPVDFEMQFGPDDRENSPTVSVGELADDDPLVVAAGHPIAFTPWEDREEWDRLPPAWHPSGVPCDDAVPPELTGELMLQKLIYVFEQARFGASTVEDPDPCMTAFPGTIVLTSRPGDWVLLQAANPKQGIRSCTYVSVRTMWECGSSPSATVSAASAVVGSIPALPGGGCMDGSALGPPP